MMLSLPSIVLIDDNLDDLNLIHKGLTEAGYPSLPIHYQNNDDLNFSGIDHINLERLCPRIIISDLNLTDNMTDPKNLVGLIGGVLRAIAPEGPYVLYFWSKNESSVEPVMELLQSRYQDLQLPLHWGVLYKSDFIDAPEKLKVKVEELLKADPIFNALFEWENRIAIAAQATTASLLKLAKPADDVVLPNYLRNFKVKIETLLSLIGNETLGRTNAVSEPDIAVELGLEPVLLDHIRSTYFSIQNNTWSNVASLIGNKINSQSYDDVKAHLNSFFHVEKLSAKSPKNKRGTWVGFSENYLKNSENSEKILRNLGESIEAIIQSEFINPSSVTGDELNQVCSELKLGFIELSAECDHAQRNVRMHRYFLSAIIPIKYESAAYKNRSGGIAHAGIYRLPNIIVDNEECIVKISFRYQVGAIPDFNKWLGEPVFRLKDQILSEISFKASQHAARPGIISFR